MSEFFLVVSPEIIIRESLLDRYLSIFSEEPMLELLVASVELSILVAGFVV